MRQRPGAAATPWLPAAPGGSTLGEISAPVQGLIRACKAHQNGHRLSSGWLGQHLPAARHRHSINLWRIVGTLEASFSRVSASFAPPP
jgi:hypothetical protein